MPTCFVIMPISTPPGLVAEYGNDHEHFQHVLTGLHAPALELAGYEVIPPAVASSEVIQAEIFKHLATADLVVCDMSTLNPNVFFELGVRVALDRPVAMIKDDQTPSIPFDTGSVGCYTYRSRVEIWQLQDEIAGLARWIRNSGERKRNAVWRIFGDPAFSATVDPARLTAGPVDVDYMMAIVRLLERTGLSGRIETFEAHLDPDHRAVTLGFETPPTEFLRARLREEAVKLDLTLHLR